MLLGAVVALSGCGDDGQQAAPVPPPPCPAGSSVVLPPLELVALVEACGTDDGAALTLTNQSPTLLRVQAGQGSLLGRVVTGTPGSLADAVRVELAMGTATPVVVDLPPGASVTANRVQAAAPWVDVSVPFSTTALDWSIATLSSFVEAQLRTPSQALQSSVAGCASEVAETWARSTVAPDVPLANLLADTALGAGLRCRAMWNTLSAATQAEPPPPQTLAQQLAGHTRSTFVDDLVRVGRTTLTVVR